MSLLEPRLSSGPRVIVVGAGVIGAFCALALLERGAAVTLVDADAAPERLALAPRAASAAAAGMLGAYSEVLYEGPTAHRMLPRLCAAGLAAWEGRLDATPALGLFVRDTGALLLAHGDADMARLLRVRDRARHEGARLDWYEGLPDDLDPHLYSLRVRAALRLKDERVVNVRPMLEALAAQIGDRGGSILRERQVSHVAARAGRAMGVAFADGSGLVADAVVLACGALAPPTLVDSVPALKRLTPAKGMLCVVRPDSASRIEECVRTMGVYAVPQDDGAIVFGSTMEMGRLDLDDDAAAGQRMFTALRQALPGARFAGEPRFHSAGIRPMSPDWAPLVGPSGPEGCFVAAGHSRNGWLLAPLTGAMIAAQIMGGPLEDLWGAFMPDRFEKRAA